MLAADISNAYLNAECAENVCFKAGSEFGDRKGQWVVARRSLYGLKSAGASFNAHLARCLEHDLEFVSSKGDRDVWMRTAVKESDGSECYKCVCTYVDDVLVTSERPEEVMKVLAGVYKLKGVAGNPEDEPWEEPKTHLGADIVRAKNSRGSTYFLMGSETYIENALKSTQHELDNEGLVSVAGRGLELNKMAKAPFPSGCRPELDASAILEPKDANWHQQLIGMLNWIVELGRIDIYNSVARPSGYLAQPREGHLRAALHMFSYLKSGGHQLLPFHPMMPVMEGAYAIPKMEDSIMEIWKNFYSDAEDEVPLDMPKALGGSVRIYCFVDADHAGDKLTRRSCTGIIIKINNAVISDEVHFFQETDNTGGCYLWI